MKKLQLRKIGNDSLLRVDLARWKDLPRAKTPELRIAKDKALPTIERCRGKETDFRKNSHISVNGFDCEDLVDLCDSQSQGNSITRDFAEVLTGIMIERRYSKDVRLAALAFLASDAIATEARSSPSHVMLSDLGLSDEQIKKMNRNLTESRGDYEKREKLGIRFFASVTTYLSVLAMSAYSLMFLDIAGLFNITSVVIVGMAASIATLPLLKLITKICHAISEKNWEKGPEKNLHELNGIITRTDEIIPRIQT